MNCGFLEFLVQFYIAWIFIVQRNLKVISTFAKILRSSESHITSTRGCQDPRLSEFLLRRKGWLPSTETVTSIPSRERRSSIDFVPSLCYTPRPSIAPQNESQPSAIPLTIPTHSGDGKSNGIKLKVINIMLCMFKKEIYTTKEI